MSEPSAPGGVVARVELRWLVDRYAQAVDQRDVEAVAELFAPDGRLVSHLHPRPGAAIVRSGRTQIADALRAGLARYVTTTHVVGGQVVDLAPGGDRAQGETTCLAHHLYEARSGGRTMLVLAVRYHDTFVSRGGRWRFFERQLFLDWRDDRPVVTGDSS